jgi:hypothetical protein
VGAIPQGTFTKTNNGNKKKELHQRKKGITMEDLKKQTALRLAQEQQESQGSFSSESPPGYVPKVASRNPFGVADPRLLPGRDSKSSFQSLAHLRHTGNSNGDFAYNRHRPEAAAGPHRLPTNGLPAGSSISKEDLKAPKERKASEKSKLPSHGLTVQELKEMTKARLQAEASQKHEDSEADHCCLSSLPASSSTFPLISDRPTGTPQPSATPTSLYGHRPSSVNSRSSFPDQLNREGWSSNESRVEAWENASASTSASDYWGSEYSDSLRVFHSHSPESHGQSSQRNRTFSSGTNDSPPALLGSAFYDPQAPFSQNRRRAATLSPHTGLKHVREDQPDFPGHDDLPGFPSFSNVSRPHHQSLAQDKELLTQQSYRYPPGLIGSDGNRARTSSLPAISRTSEDFGTEPFLSSRFGRVDEDNAQLFDQVFRDTATDHGTSSLDLIGGIEILGISGSRNGGFGAGMQLDNRLRAATWSEPSTDLFGPIGSGRDTLSSILNLSSADERPSFLPPDL